MSNRASQSVLSGHCRDQATDPLARYYQALAVLSGEYPFGAGKAPRAERDACGLIRETVAGGNLRASADCVRRGMVDLIGDSLGLQSGRYWACAFDDEIENVCRGFLRNAGLGADAGSALVYGVSTLQLFHALLSSIAKHDPSDVVLAVSPFYFHLVPIARLYGFSFEAVTACSGQSLKVTPDDLRRSMSRIADSKRRVRVLVLTNPTFSGESYSPRERKELLECLAETSVESQLVIEDAALFNPISPEGEPLLLADETETKSSVACASLFTVGKAYCSPELAFAFGVVPPMPARSATGKTCLADAVSLYLNTSMSEVSRIAKRGALAALTETPKQFLAENAGAYRERVRHLCRTGIPSANRSIHAALQSNLQHSGLRRLLASAGILLGDTISREHEWISIRLEPTCGRDVLLCFRGCALLSDQQISDNQQSPVVTPWGQPFDNSLHVVRLLMDCGSALGKSRGVVLSPGWSMGLHSGLDRYTCRLSVGQIGHSAGVGQTCIHNAVALDCLDEVCRRMGEGVCELLLGAARE